MKKYFKKFKGIFCLVMCLCMVATTFQVGVFAENNDTTATTQVVISEAKLNEGNNNEVFGNGILTGTTDNGTSTMDDKCWDSVTDENRGYDNSDANNIVRSFDIIKYNVTTTLNNLGGTAHKLGYQVTIPDDDALDVTTEGTQPTCTKSNGLKTYTFDWDIPANQGAGGIEHPFSIKVGNKHQGDTIKPSVSVYVDSPENNHEVTNVKEVIVTSAPMYNIVLKKGNLNTSKNVYDFNQSGSKADCLQNATGYKDSKVTGFRQVFGVGLEMKRPGNGIKGTELPDPDQGITFDIDLSAYTIGDVSATDRGFVPLLYYYGPNNAGGAQVAEIPYTNKNAAGNVTGSVYCDDSGTYTMVQEGTQLHVTVKNFSINYNNFPKKNPKGDTYWDTVEAMKDGFFSSFQFHIVYPYKNAAGKTLVEAFNVGDTGTANASITVDNMKAQCINKKDTTNTETIPLKKSDGSINENNDNTQSETFTMSRNGRRDHKIIYSNRDRQNWLSGYFLNSGNNDNDISVVGANDLAFSVAYDQTNVGEADESSQIPLAIEQMVLFDRNAIELEKNGHVDLSNNTGYTGSYKYLKHRNGRLSSEDMKTAKLEDFDIMDDPTNCDGVLVQYEGCYNKNESSVLSQITRFFCNIKNDYDLSDKVYMITAVSNTWDASDLTDDEKSELLAHYNKTSLNDITRAQYSEWIKNKKINFFDRNHNVSTIDHRDYYTVPEYQNKIYQPSSTHKFANNSADALYLVPYKVSIQKKVAQKDTDNAVRTQYNVSKNQRYVDYEVNSQLIFANNVTAPKGSKTNVYYQDTLAKGLTYIEGSMYLGGTYTSDFPNQGKVTGGQSITPEVINNADGTTTLKWTVENVSLNKMSLDKIHYSCKIGDEDDLDKDVAENVTLKNDIKIQTDEDKRPYSADNDNEASTSITILKDKEFYLTKTGKKTLELEDEGYFDLTITNTSSNDIQNLFALDTMPCDGIGNTIMKGKYSLNEVSVNKKYLKSTTDDYEIYYTSNQKYKGQKVDIIKASDITEENGWKKATKATEGDLVKFTGDGLIGSWPTAIVYKDDNLERNTIARIRIKYHAVAAKGDHLENALSVPNGSSKLENIAKVDIVKRSLEGTVWVDKDKDGKLENNEKKVKNVKVTLYQKQSDGTYAPAKAYKEVIKNENGDYEEVTYPTILTTDDNGHYKFEGLPEGDFKVVFESSNDKDISNYGITQSGTDKDSSKVNEGNVVKINDKLQSGSILDIKMPSKEEMISKDEKEYNLPYQNLGLTVPNITISGTKTWIDQNNYDGLRPDSITLQIKNGDVLVKEIKVKESDNWNWSAELPKYDDNMNEIQYIVSEKKVEGYESTVNGYDVTNTHTVTPLIIPVAKVWNDNNNQDGMRPNKVIVHLYANSKDTNKTIELSEANQWHGSFENLDQYEKGQKIVYTVVEDEVKGYQVGITGSQDTSYTLTNTHDSETVEVKGTKTWDDHNDQDKKRPSKITVRLLADGKEIAAKEVTKDSEWIYNFGNLVKYKDGQEINYEVKEDKVEGYKTSIKGFNITNSHIPTTPSKPSSDTPSKDDQKPHDDQSSKETPKGEQSSKSEQSTPVVKGETKATNKIKTGDDTHLILYVLFALLSIMGILFLKKKAHN